MWKGPGKYSKPHHENTLSRMWLCFICSLPLYLHVQAQGNIGRFRASGGCRLDGNSAGDNGGAVFLRTLGTTGQIHAVTWTDASSLCNNNASGSGGGLYASSQRAVSLVVSGASAWMGNSAQMDGGAVNIVTAMLPNAPNSSIAIGGQSLVSRNSARKGGAIYVDAFSRLFISDGSTVTMNTAAFDGGAVYLSQLPTEVCLESCSLMRNRAAHGSGGGLFVATVSAMRAASGCENRKNRKQLQDMNQVECLALARIELLFPITNSSQNCFLTSFPSFQKNVFYMIWPGHSDAPCVMNFVPSIYFSRSVFTLRPAD